jgi:hypothetical protein
MKNANRFIENFLLDFQHPKIKSQRNHTVSTGRFKKEIEDIERRPPSTRSNPAFAPTWIAPEPTFN